MTEAGEARITMSIDLKKYRIRVHKQTLKALGSPSFVQLLFSPRRNAIVILSCEKQTPSGQEIPVQFDKPDSSGTFDIYCKELITRIQIEFNGLNHEGLYHLSGFLLPEGNGVCFPLNTLSRVETANV